VRAVKTNAFVWAAVVVIAGLHEAWALYAAIVGLLLAVVPMLFAPKLVPVQNEHGHHDGTLYRAQHPGQGAVPINPRPSGGPSYRNGSGS
jgi:hypothetical protein